MRRRLVLSTIAVTTVALIVVLVPVLVIVNNANDDVTVDFAEQAFRLAIVALVAIAAAAGLAAIQARQLARPLERLARSAGRLGDGDFTALTGASSGIDEIDDIARALRLSAGRIDRMLESERAFTADATHQLRTGLTGIAMRLELLERSADPATSEEAAATLEQLHELNQTLDELLAVARRGTTGERTDVDLVELVDHHVADWQGRFNRRHRQIVVTTGATSRVHATPGLVGQVLNIVFENSLQHGAGTLAVMISGVSVTVEDDGPGIAPEREATLFERPSDPHAAHGRGLPLARRLAESDGGRLELVQPNPPVFRLTLLDASGAPRT